MCRNKEALFLYHLRFSHMKAPIEDMEEYSLLKVAFKGFFTGSVFYCFQHLGMCTSQTFSFLYHFRFPFHKRDSYGGLGTGTPV